MKVFKKLFLLVISLNLLNSLHAQSSMSKSQLEDLFDGSIESTFQKSNSNGIRFIENKGQMHDQNYQSRPDVLFGAMAGNMTFHLKTNGVSYQLNRVDSYKFVEDPKTKKEKQEIDRQTIYRIDLNWLNANTNFVTSTDKSFEGYDNFYNEVSPESGILNVKSYDGITLKNLYPGIDLHYYDKAGELKHDYIVSPGANYEQILLSVDGAEVTINKDGSLLLNTPLGSVQEGAPIVFQNGKKLIARWVVLNSSNDEMSSVIGFEIDNYNPNEILIIDPVTRFWGTYYGGSADEYGYSSCTDNNDNVYVSGYTVSTGGTSIITAGSHQSSFGGGNDDAFLVKFNSQGVRQWGTYYGGSGAERGNSCATDGAGNVYMAGHTSSQVQSVIATSGAYQSLYGGGSQDAFLVKFNDSGVRIWGTYYGGNYFDRGYSCCTDPSGNVFMTGFTETSTDPAIASPSSHQPDFGGGFGDAFLVKFNSQGTREWGTYYGGSGAEDGNGCSADLNGNVYLAGVTNSSAAQEIATAGSFQSTFGGNTDAFLIKFNPNGVRQWGTYYGGNGDETGYACANDGSGNVYLTGITETIIAGIISTPGSHQASFGGGTDDAFLVKFNPTGTREWGTYCGGNGYEAGKSVQVDAFNNIVISGITNSNDGLLVSSDAYQSTFGGNYDAFLSRFNSAGVRSWGTYFGGTGLDEGYGCSIDNSGNVYLTGRTSSNSGSVIASAGCHQPSYGGGTFDGFLVKFSGSLAELIQTESSSFKVYPNPTKDQITIDGFENKISMVSIYNSIGQKLQDIKVENPSSKFNVEMPVEKGIYFVEVRTDNMIIDLIKVIKN